MIGTTQAPLTAPQRAHEAQRDTHPPHHHEEHREAGRQDTRAPEVTGSTQPAQTKSTKTRGEEYRREGDRWVGGTGWVGVVTMRSTSPRRIPTTRHRV